MKDVEAAKCLMLIPRVRGDVKSIAKRLSEDGQEPWPEELKTFLSYLRVLEEQIEEKHPVNIK
jgi:hypothetical protein